MIETIEITCDDSSHAPKVAKIAPMILDAARDVWAAVGGHPTEDGVVVVDGAPRPIRDAFGTSTRGPTNYPDFSTQAVNQRQAFTCPLCGRRAEMVPSTADRIGHTLATAGVSSVTLRGLAAIL